MGGENSGHLLCTDGTNSKTSLFQFELSFFKLRRVGSLNNYQLIK